MNMTGFAPRNLATGESVQLAMQNLWLTGRVLPMGARLWVRHEFQSQESKPIEVVYSFMLPRDATLRRFRVSGEGFSVASELREKSEAREIYEQGVQAGSLSTLAQQYGDGMVNLSIGNIRPGEKVVVLLELMVGVELHDDGLRLRFPFTLAPSYHSKARVIESEPGVGEIELPEEEFGDIILPKFMKDAKDLHQVGFALDLHMGDGVEEIASPSHALRVQLNNGQSSRVLLARESDLPDRDLVLDIRRKTKGVSVFSGIDHENKGRIAAIIPSTEFGEKSTEPRRLVILLDRSGSMGGVPIEQAKKAIAACLATLDEKDQFALVAFDDQVEVFRNELTEATKKQREAAQKFLAGIGARGGTELATGLEAAAKLLHVRNAAGEASSKPGDVMIFTDGQVFATEAILERVRATGARVHSLGIGSASQDRFLAFLASHTGGVSRFMTPSERVDLAALELFAAIGRPVAEDIKVTIDGVANFRVAPEVAKYAFSGTPLLVFAESSASVNAQLQITWKGQRPEQQHRLPVALAANPLAGTLRLLQGARIISDCESRQMPEAHGSVEKRESSRHSKLLAQLSREYGLPSSQMSLVAVVKRAGDVAGEIPKTQIVPVGLPPDMQFEGVFGVALCAPAGAPMTVAPAQMARGISLSAPLPPPMPQETGRPLIAKVVGAGMDMLSSSLGKRKAAKQAEASEPVPQTPDDLLMVLAGMLEPDGGMPGFGEEQRILNSVAALLFFVAQGSTRNSGPFRVHVDKLISFLTTDRLHQLNPNDVSLVSSVLREAIKGHAPKGDWNFHASTLASRQDVDRKKFRQELSTPVA